MKKIKSVKLKNDYRSESAFIPEGTLGEKGSNAGVDFYIFRNSLNHAVKTFYKHEITTNLTGLFKIEYEEERKYIDVRIEYDPFKNAFDSIQKIYVNDVKRALCSDLNSKFNIKVIELAEGTL